MRRISNNFRNLDLAKFASYRSISTSVPSVTRLINNFLKIHSEDFVKKIVDKNRAATQHYNKISAIQDGHKIIASRTMWEKLFGELVYEIESPIQKKADEIGKEKLMALIASNPIELDFTSHPTEGQNEEFIGIKKSIIKSQVLIGKVMFSYHVKASDVIDLNRIRISYGLAKLPIDHLPSYRNFINSCSETCEVLVKRFMSSPIHHIDKMTVEIEREMLLNRMLDVKKHFAKLRADFPDYIPESQIKIGSWVGDRDGKDNIQAGHVVVFSYWAQKKFFKSLIEQLDDFADLLTMYKIDNSDLRNPVIDKIIYIISMTQNKIFIGDEAIKMEARINMILAKYPLDDNPELLKAYTKIREFIKSSGCKLSSNGFSSREEVDKVIAAAEEIEKLCFDGELLSMEMNVEKIAQKFIDLTPETKRQIMCMMESAILNNRHQHIISQFDCKLSSYKKTLYFYELVKQLPRFHQQIPFFKEYYDKISQVEGFDLYEQLFSDNSIAAAKKSMVELSPLAESEDTIIALSSFTAELLADPECLKYIKASGGILRQTRSNSDGPASLGSQAAAFRHIQADSEIEKLAQLNGLNFKKLTGMGVNDSDRNGPWSYELTPAHATIQGSDGQNQEIPRLVGLLLKPQDRSFDKLDSFIAKYPSAQIDDLIGFYHKLHMQSEFGPIMNIDGRDLYLGKIIHRSHIHEKTLKFLDRLSARPSNRGGENKSVILLSNIDLSLPSETMYKQDMRRIGETNTHRLCFSSFALAPFYEQPEGLEGELLADYYDIPQNSNIAFTALFKLGIADYKSLFITNGLNVRIDYDEILRLSKEYQKFLSIADKEGEAAAFSYAESKGFNDLESMKKYISSYHVVKAKSVLRNIVTPLIFHSDENVKELVNKILEEVELSYQTFIDFDEPVIKVLDVLVNDQSQEISDRKVYLAIAQQIHNVRKPNHYFDTRKELILQASDAMEWQDDKSFNQATDLLAIITRSAGNPVSGVGGKIGGDADKFNYIISNTTKPVLDIRSLLLDFKAEKEPSKVSASAKTDTLER